ncbi:MAG: Fic family protein [Coriobacteriia bacterium]|nr:Fic family protein [Coriobacteriia bacterium]
MKTFDYKKTSYNALLDEVRKCQGKMEFVRMSFPELLESLKDSAAFEEAYFSTKIEGIILDYKGCKKLMDKLEQASSSHAGDVSDFVEQFRGYAKVLLTINKRIDFFKVDTTSILAMFYALFNIPADYKESVYRKVDYQDMIQDGKVVSVRVSPVESYETPLYIGSATTALCEAFDEAPTFNIINIAKYMVDFMCIRPFDAGCGRVMRLFAYLLLLKSDIDIVKYVSMSKIFEANASDYYETMSLCCGGWDEDKNTYEPFIEFFLKCIIKAYNILFEQTKFKGGKKLKGAERVFEYFKNNKCEVCKKDLQTALPDISLSTIENALHKLKSDGKIIQVGGGRSTRYKIS